MVNLRIERIDSVIVVQITEGQQISIVSQLAKQSTLQGIVKELAIATNKHQITATISEQYLTYEKLFKEEAAQWFPLRQQWDHAIKFTYGMPDAIDFKTYPMPQHEDKALKEFLEEQLAKGYIWPSKSQYTSSFFVIKKQDGKLQPVQDYHAINQWANHNQYPLPLIFKLIWDLSGAHIFTKLNIWWEYNNICIKGRWT